MVELHRTVCRYLRNAPAAISTATSTGELRIALWIHEEIPHEARLSVMVDSANESGGQYIDYI